MHSCQLTQQVHDTHTHKHTHSTVQSEIYMSALNLDPSLLFQLIYLRFILLCCSKMSPNTLPIMSFPLTSSILACSTPLVPFFNTVSCFFFPQSHPMIYYFFLLILILPLSGTIVRFVVGPISIFSCWTD